MNLAGCSLSGTRRPGPVCVSDADGFEHPRSTANVSGRRSRRSDDEHHGQSYRCENGMMVAIKGRVLVVDDDTALAEMLGIVLRGEGFEPSFVADGDKALAAFRETKPD